MRLRIYLAGFATLAVAAVAFYALNTTRRDPVMGWPVMGWQTYCAVPERADARPADQREIAIERIGRASDDIRSGHLFIHDGKLIAWDVAKGAQFAFDDGDFTEQPAIHCPKFKAAGWTFSYGDGRSTACKGGKCVSIDVKPSTLPFAYASHQDSVFVGTSFGDALLFKNGEWCRMARNGNDFSCPDEPSPPPSKPSNQFYSSTHFDGRTLIGEYPTGMIFEFDGTKVFPSQITPPGIPATGSPGFESQTLMSYCGNLFVGYWPYGDLHRFDGEAWRKPIRMFQNPADLNEWPYRREADAAGLVFNFFGQRVTSLIPLNGALYAITSNKGDWSKSVATGIHRGLQTEYGTVYKITLPSCVGPL